MSASEQGESRKISLVNASTPSRDLGKLDLEEDTAMIRFPVHNAALDLKSKDPATLPHGLVPIPPEVREVVETRRDTFRPEVFAGAHIALLNHETINWYFDNLGHEVVYRPTPEGPEVLAVGAEEVDAFRRATPPEEQRKLEGFLGY